MEAPTKYGTLYSDMERLTNYDGRNWISKHSNLLMAICIMILLVFLGISTYGKTNGDSSLNSDELKLSADGEAEVPCWTNLPHKKCAEASECCTGDCQPDGWCARNETKEVNIAVILACVHLLTLGFPFELGASYGVSIFLLVPDNTPLPCRVVWLCGPR